MKYKVCMLCVGVTSLWILLSAGVAWGYLSLVIYQLPIAFLMGGTVVGVANKISSVKRKAVVITLGMTIAYLFLIHTGKGIVILETITMLLVAHLLFKKKEDDPPLSLELKEELTKCCD